MAANLNKKFYFIRHLCVLYSHQILLIIGTQFLGLITKFIEIRDKLIYDDINGN